MTERPNGLTYAQAGVDIDAGNALVERIKPLAKATRRAGAARGLGQGLDPLNQGVAGVDIDTGLGVGEPVGPLGHGGVALRNSYVDATRPCRLGRAAGYS